MTDPRRTATTVDPEELQALAEITAQDKAVNVPFAERFCGQLTQAMLDATETPRGQ